MYCRYLPRYLPGSHPITVCIKPQDNFTSTRMFGPSETESLRELQSMMSLGDVSSFHKHVFKGRVDTTHRPRAGGSNYEVGSGTKTENPGGGTRRRSTPPRDTLQFPSSPSLRPYLGEGETRTETGYGDGRSGRRRPERRNDLSRGKRRKVGTTTFLRGITTRVSGREGITRGEGRHS